jgi:DNA-binding winged helix-turn-helix (wHTH) protein/Tol biopolymer transport system component
MKEETRRIYAFDAFQVDPARRRVWNAGRPVQIHSKTFDLLLVLIENSGRELEKDELLRLVWPNQVVEEGNLTVKMSALRKALGERKDEARFIVTIPGRGYRFVANVKQIEAGGGALLVEHHAVTHVVVEESSESSEVAPADASPLSDVSKSPRLITRRATRIWVVAGVALFVIVAGLVVSRRFSTRSITPPFERFEVARQTNTGRVLAAAVAPDGKYFAFAQDEPEGRSLWLKHVETGGSTRIVEAKPVEYWGLTFAPDGNHIYATTFEKSNADPVLTKIPVLPGAMQTLPVVTNTSVTFAPDGSRMAYVVSSSSSGGSVLWTARTDGSDKKFVALRKDPNYFSMQANTVAWSPDGQTLACIVLNNSDEGFYMTVVGYLSQSGEERSLTRKHWNIVTSIAWAPDGRGFWLTGNEKQGLPQQVWYIATVDGDARRITNDLNSYNAVSVTSDGRSLLTVQTDRTSSIWTAPVNQNGNANDFREEFSEVGDVAAIGWTADGNLIYQSSASGAQELWRLEIETKRTKQLTVGSLVSDFAISPDGRYIVLVSNRAGRPNLWRVNAEDGSDLRQLTNGSGEVRPRFDSQGRFIFFQKGFGDVLSSVWKVPIEGGEAQQVNEPHNTFPDVSPDGKQIVYSYMDESSGPVKQWRLGVAAGENGKRLASFAVPATVTNRLTRWTPDGQGLIYINTVGGTSNLWLQPASGGVPRAITSFTSHRIQSFDWSRDGKRLAIVRAGHISDVLLLRDTRMPDR